MFRRGCSCETLHIQPLGGGGGRGRGRGREEEEEAVIQKPGGVPENRAAAPRLWRPRRGNAVFVLWRGAGRRHEPRSIDHENTDV
ncbi:hypothetical protein EYF80_050730 [Liparis tanakae]|uniref:Uncharacterized protein n=1 Tax=Liparis tanakae TaxID=230148 RepID=A0A4Z2FDY5_9TELE|nr:hypothetical protein EYF80_050730 [Liparis tanakae]